MECKYCRSGVKHSSTLTGDPLLPKYARAVKNMLTDGHALLSYLTELIRRSHDAICRGLSAPHSFLSCMSLYQIITR
jgi:hypothetical protein